MSLIVGLVVIAVLAALAQAERKGVLQGMLSRPLVLGTAVGWALGEPGFGLMVGAVLELLWLGSINVGANLPDHEVAGTAAVVGAAVLGAAGEPVGYEYGTLAIAGLLPIAALGRRMDSAIEQRNTAMMPLVERRLAAGRSPGSAHLLGLVAPSVAAATLAAAGAALGALSFPHLVAALPPAVREGLATAFPLLAVGCGAWGVASIREERAVVWAGGALVLGLLAVTLFLWRFGA